MQQDDAGLFQVRFTEKGRKSIRRLASISYFIFALVLFSCGLNIYSDVKSLLSYSRNSASPGINFQLLHYTTLVVSLMTIVGNFYYIRFPHVLLNCLENKDESGANKAFGLLVRSGIIFLAYLVIGAVFIIFSLTKSII